MKNDSGYTKAMVVVAHPDDAEYGCSGSVAEWCLKGWDVVYTLCTDGSKGSDDPNMTTSKLTEIRYAEQIEAGKILGLKKVEFLGYSDAFLEPSLELRKDIVRMIRKHKPDILVCQSPYRSLSTSYAAGHPDHLAAGEASMSGVYPASRDRLTYPDLLEEGLLPHKVRELWIMSSGPDADYVNEITEEGMEKSKNALKAHVSQVNEESISRMTQWKKEAGEPHGFAYAEKFKKILLK